MLRNRTEFSKIITALPLLLICAVAAAQQTIRVGMSTALSGPAQELGKHIHSGVTVYFQHINEQQDNYRFELTVLDDGYEPLRTGPNMRQLIEQENVIAILGNVGTPTAIVSLPIINQAKVLFFGAYTGAGILRKNPPDRYVINYRASYAEETAAMIKVLLARGIKPEEIAFFTQNDGYGDAGYRGAIEALKAAGYEDAEKLTHGRYMRNTLNVEGALAQFLESDIEPKAFIIVGAYAPVAKFIRLAREDFADALFLNVSFVGSRALAAALGADGDGVIISQVVPHYDADYPVIRDYRKILKKYQPQLEPSFVSLEGFIIAKIFADAIVSCQQQGIDREKVIDCIEQFNFENFDMGTRLTLDPQNHQASHQVWLTEIKKGAIIPYQWHNTSPEQESRAATRP